jgi:stage III sporulation protein AE
MKNTSAGLKRWISIIVILYIFAVFIMSIGQAPIFAAAEALSDKDKTETELDRIVEEQLNELDLEELQEYLNSLHSFSDESVTERLMAYIKGEEFDYQTFLKDILNILSIKIKEILPAFLCIASIALSMGLILSLRSGIVGGTSTDMIFLIGFSAALIPLIAVLTECITESVNCIKSMQTQMQLIYPLILTLMAASGGMVSAAIVRPAVSFFSTGIVALITSVIIPLTITIIAFSIAANLSKELKIGKFTAFFKSINKWIIGLSISIFGLFFTMQGITAVSYDGVMRRAAKYAIGNGVPIIGGFLSGGFDLAIAGSILIKNSLGSMGVFLMVFVLIEPLILLLAFHLLLRLTAAITQPFGDSRISDFLGELADNMQFCVASILFTAFLYFLSIVFIVCSSEAFI